MLKVGEFIRRRSGKLGQNRDAVQGGCNPDSFTVRPIETVFYADYRGFTERPASSTDSETRRQHDNELQFRTGFQSRLGIKKHTGRTQIASQAGVLCPFMTHLDRDTNWHARSRATIAGAFMLHMLRKCTPVRGKNALTELKKKLLPKMREERGKEV
jgi:hypothetical protein